MSEIVVDRTTRDRLMAGGDTVLIKDEAGVLIGQFQKCAASVEDVLGLGIDIAELRRRGESEGTTYTTTEVLAYAKSRTP